MIRVAIFASGAGSNAEKIIAHFKLHPVIKIVVVVCNKPHAGVIHIAEKNNIPVLMIDRERFFSEASYLKAFREMHIDWIILAGFLWKIPEAFTNAYAGKIINIHPALLPKYGGKGMYGLHVHEAVIANKEKESGISIHYVDDIYDHGNIIAQHKCMVAENETPASLAAKVHQLEHRYYPAVVEEVIIKAKGTLNQNS